MNGWINLWGLMADVRGRGQGNKYRMTDDVRRGTSSFFLRIMAVMVMVENGWREEYDLHMMLWYTKMSEFSAYQHVAFDMSVQ